METTTNATGKQHTCYICGKSAYYGWDNIPLSYDQETGIEQTGDVWFCTDCLWKIVGHFAWDANGDFGRLLEESKTQGHVDEF